MVVRSSKIRPRITRAVVEGTRYARFGCPRCDRCARFRLLYYVTPDVPGRAWCRPCINTPALAVS